MTIRRGEAWGSVGPAPASMVRAHTDAEVAALAAAAGDNGEPPTVALLGGDLMRACGGFGADDRLAGREAGAVARLPLDVLRVEADGQIGWAAAHVVVRRSWWRGQVVVLANGQFIGRWDVSPRCHPNDGRVDVVTVDAAMSIRQRWQAWRRLPLGTHVPHPSITIRQRPDVELALDRPADVYLDGVRWCRASTVRCAVVPDAVVACV